MNGNTLRTVVTVVGTCTDPACTALQTPHFQLGASAFQMVSFTGEASIPGQIGDILTCSYVECPVPDASNGQPERIRANVMIAGGTPASVLFVGQRLGIVTASVMPAGGPNALPLSRDTTTGYWVGPNNTLGSGLAMFSLTDTNGRQISFSLDVINPGGAYVATTAQFLPCSP